MKGQIKSVLDDIGADAIKIGMLHSSELIRGIKETLEPYQVRNIVLDPVMVATSGDKLLLDEAIATLKNELIPTVITSYSIHYTKLYEQLVVCIVGFPFRYISTCVIELAVVFVINVIFLLIF